MSRLIKFRAWDETGKQMMFSGLHDKNWYTESKAGLCIRGKHQDDIKIPIMQFTGLHDKNGKEIYEGDIVRVSKRLWPDSKYWVETVKVDPLTSNQFDPDIGGGQDYEETVMEIEIIGNVHQNPELLES